MPEDEYKETKVMKYSETWIREKENTDDILINMKKKKGGDLGKSYHAQNQLKTIVKSGQKTSWRY